MIRGVTLRQRSFLGHYFCPVALKPSDLAKGPTSDDPRLRSAIVLDIGLYEVADTVKVVSRQVECRVW